MKIRIDSFRNFGLSMCQIHKYKKKKETFRTFRSEIISLWMFSSVANKHNVEITFLYRCSVWRGILFLRYYVLNVICKFMDNNRKRKITIINEYGYGNNNFFAIKNIRKFL